MDTSLFSTKRSREAGSGPITAMTVVEEHVGVVASESKPATARPS